jgi:hypothetical protein
MAVDIVPPADHRVEEILKDPARYFSKARERVQKEVELEIKRERALSS